MPFYEPDLEGLVSRGVQQARLSFAYDVEQLRPKAGSRKGAGRGAAPGG